MLDFERKLSNKEIYYAESQDGIKWEIEPNPVAITQNILLKNGTTVHRGATECPSVLIENGIATHAFFATKNKENTHSWNMCVPLKKLEQSLDNKSCC